MARIGPNWVIMSPYLGDSGVQNGVVEGLIGAMAVRSPTFLAGAFLVLAVSFSVYFNVAVRVDANSANARFEQLTSQGALARAATHGERALALLAKDGKTVEDLAPLKLRVADAQLERRRHDRVAALLLDALATKSSQQ